MSVSFQYIDGEGGTYSLATATHRKLMGFGGVGMVAPEHFWQDLPDRDGSEHLGHRMPRRTMNFVVKQAASTRGSAWTQKRDIAEAFSLDKGRGRIKATLPDGTVREIYARYTGGLDFSTEDSETPWIQDFPIQVVCEESHWRSSTVSSASANFNGAASVGITCNVEGDVPTYPTIRVGAAVEHPVLTLGGGTIDIDANIAAGTLEIDCSEPTVTMGATNYMGSATAASEFWELARGGNSVSITATSGSGLCKISWTDKWEALRP